MNDKGFLEAAEAYFKVCMELRAAEKTRRDLQSKMENIADSQLTLGIKLGEWVGTNVRTRLAALSNGGALVITYGSNNQNVIVIYDVIGMPV